MSKHLVTGRCPHGKKPPRRFDEQFKQEAVRFLEGTGRPVAEVARELKVSQQALWRVAEAVRHGDDRDAEPSDAAELRRLRRENAILRQERDFLKRATAYFANPPE